MFAWAAAQRSADVAERVAERQIRAERKATWLTIAADAYADSRTVVEWFGASRAESVDPGDPAEDEMVTRLEQSPRCTTRSSRT